MSTAGRTLLLITASAPEIQRVRRGRVLNFQQITMPYLAALATPQWKVIHVDEVVRPVDFGLPVDLVAITFHTPSAPHTYAIADQFRREGTPVVLGGPHVTLLPDEAQEHADAIFVGEAESSWPQFLREFEAGQLSPKVLFDGTSDFGRHPDGAERPVSPPRPYGGSLVCHPRLPAPLRFLHAPDHVSKWCAQATRGSRRGRVRLFCRKGDYSVG